MCIYTVFILLGCGSNNVLQLKRIDFNVSTLKNTIEYDSKDNIYIVNQKKYGFLGNFTNNYYIIKKDKNGHATTYEIQLDKHEWLRTSNTEIAIVKPYKTLNSGWIKIVNGKFSSKLPGIDSIMSELKHDVSNSFIRQTNGYIDQYLNGKIIKSYNYGNFITKFKTVNFDTLKYQLYKLDSNSLKAMSDNPDDIYKQKDGIFFIPSPGIGLIAKFNKRKIYDELDSISKQKNTPEYIKILPN